MSEALDNIKKNFGSKGGKRLRIVLILAAVCVVVAVVSFMRSSTGRELPSMAGVDVGGNTVGDQTSVPLATNVVYESMVRTSNAERAEAAEKAGKSAVAVLPHAPAAKIDYAEASVVASTSVNVATPTAVPPTAQNQVSQIEMARDQARKEEFDRWRKVWDAPVEAKVYVGGVKDEPKAAAQAQTAVTQSQQTASAGGSALTQSVSQEGKTVKVALTEAYATTEIPCSTETAPVCIIKILSGPFAGGMAKGEVALRGNAGELKFTTLTHNGKTYAIDAYGMDENTRKLVVDGQLDRKWWERYGFPFFANALSSAGQILSQMGTTAVYNTPFGGIGGVVRPDMSVDRILLSASGQSVGQVSAGIAAAGRDAKPTISVRAGEGIGLMFMADATLK